MKAGRNCRRKQKCGICMENKYVSEKIRNKEAAIACPDAGCKVGTLTPEMCKPVLTREVFDHWSNLLMKYKFSCPFKECSGFVYTTEDSEGKCYQCYRHFCCMCESIWHPNLACKDVQQLRQDDWEKEDLLLVELANKQGWKRCPFCTFYVEKVSGCPNILCR
ncbi:E3 ubiquitin-protein ligase RNF144A-like isoform X2 [Dendrobium catenatum]|uniref:E3 ubiquitin-protein ligase RNF144A-like isoform X2 n=1 Tax=Dendrobium catenatum TaxID=906689 RepID=UPI00109FDEC2|nr:E3 ubiquitin-protein ligase RNF144A-like isoform X2 [Dendrobium catenatum]